MLDEVREVGRDQVIQGFRNRAGSLEFILIEKGQPGHLALD